MTSQRTSADQAFAPGEPEQDAPAPRIGRLFRGPAAGARDRRAILMPYITGGFPSLRICEAVVSTVINEGADVLELGIPFSDPVADGPVVQASSHVALQSGVTPDDVFALAAAASARVPVVLLVYANSVIARGIETFMDVAAASGVEALVVPDLPVDEADEVAAAAAARGMALVPLAAPTATDTRIDLIAASATSFIYCVAVTGVTGPREILGDELGRLCARLRRRTAAPLVAGFGISTPEHAAAAASVADGVIIGSALIRAVARAGRDEHAACEAAAALLRPVRAALQQPALQ